MLWLQLFLLCDNNLWYLFYSHRLSGHQTLGRLPSHHSAHLAGPNNGKYATLSKQCKTLESNDFYWESLACTAGEKGENGWMRRL